MAETTNLKNINFMSKERFDSLTDIDESQLYAVEMMIDDEDLVHTTMDETIDGIKTFNSSPIVPTILDTKDSSKKASSTAFVTQDLNKFILTISVVIPVIEPLSLRLIVTISE